jgi:hypothetical protein
MIIKSLPWRARWSDESTNIVNWVKVSLSLLFAILKITEENHYRILAWERPSHNQHIRVSARDQSVRVTVLAALEGTKGTIVASSLWETSCFDERTPTSARETVVLLSMFLLTLSMKARSWLPYHLEALFRGP